MAKKIIAVAGATGAQGGGLARAIAADKNSEFTVRALTRNADSKKARELAELGIEVVQADVDDQTSLERAFAGAYGAFCVTFFWEHMSPEREMQQAKNLALAAKTAGISHAIWSTLEDTRVLVPLTDERMPTLKDKYKVPHFDAKGESDRYFAEAGVPTTYLLTSFYWDNFIHFGMGPKPGPDGTLALTLPMADRRLPGIAAEDIGKCAYGIFQRGSDFIGKRVGIAGDHATGQDMAIALTGALRQDVVYNSVPPDVYRSFGFPGADDLGNMFQYKVEHEADFCRARSLALSKELNPSLLGFEGWLDRYAAQIPLG